MSRLKPTPPREALRQLQAAQNKSFFRRPQSRLAVACVLLFVLIGVMQMRFREAADPQVADEQLARELMENPVTRPGLKTPQEYYVRARVYLEHGRPAEAISDYNHVIQQDPEAVLAYKGRGQVFLRVKKYGAALADFEKVLSLNPDDEMRREVLNNRGLIRRQWGQHKAAIADYLAAIQAGAPPVQKALLYSNIGLAYEALKDYKKAHVAYQAAQTASSRYTLAYLFEGRLFWREQQPARALPLLEKVTGDRPDLKEGWTLLATVAEVQQKPEILRRALTNACQLEVESACQKLNPS